MLKVAGYVRVSRVAGREGVSFQSPGAQEDAIRAHAAAKGCEVERVEHELDASGGTMARAKLTALVEAVERGELAGIVVARVDRFARTTEAATTIRRLRDAGGFLLAVEGALDTRDAGGTSGLVLNLLLSVAEFEREQKSEAIEAAKVAAVERGWHIAGTVPVGFRRVQAPAGKGSRRGGLTGGLVLDPAKADAIADAFKLRAGGASYAKVAAFLNSELPGGPSGTRGRWHVGTVARLLSNPVYLGEARQGVHRNADAHPAIIDRRTFDTCQALAAARGREFGTRTRESRALLAGLVKCACGASMTRSKAGGKYSIYRCHANASACTCDAPASCSEPALDAIIEAAALPRLLPSVSGASTLRDVSISTPAIEAAHAKLEAARAEADGLADPRIVSALGPDRFASAVALADEAVAEAEAALAEAVGARGAGVGGSLAASEPVSRVWQPGEFEAAHVAERRDALAGIIERVTVRRAPRGTALADRVEIVWRGGESAVEIAADDLEAVAV